MISNFYIASLLSDFEPAALAVVIVGLVVGASNFLLLRGARKRKREGRIARQLSFFTICCVGGVGIVLTLPLEENLRGQMLSLGGLVFTAVVGLGSTTLFSNAMAGLMLRTMHGFRPGDFIEVEGKLGRVTERGLFHTEIQTEHRDLCTLPNLYLATRPVQVISATGTMIAGEVSLGYDVAHDRITKLLEEAAEACGLSEPFVRIMSLGDYSVVYRVSGFLEEVKQLLSARSNLNAAMLDALHSGGVEIVSPSFMNQRALDPAKAVIPRKRRSKEVPLEGSEAEALIFDKADRAERLDELKKSRTKLLEDAKELEGELGKREAEEAEDLRRQVLDLRARAAAIDEELEAEEASEEQADS